MFRGATSLFVSTQRQMCALVTKLKASKQANLRKLVSQYNIVKSCFLKFEVVMMFGRVGRL